MASQNTAKTICLFVLAAISVFFAGFLLLTGKTLADSDNAASTLSVNSNNVAPNFTADPHEDPTSDNSTPTDVGDDITIKATAADSNGNQWYLAICKTNEVATTTNAAPTCPGGAWDVSDAANSGSEAIASYTVQESDTSESYAWYGFACDKTTDNPLCSSMSNSGTSGNNGSPFAVNHRPTFSAVSDDGPKDPGAADLTITADTYADSDTGGSQDTVSMYVCKSNDFTGTACGGGGTWCSQTGVTPGNTLACDLTIPTPQAHGNVSYYPYIIDSHNLVASGGKQGSAETFTVNDVAPTISGTPSLNSGGAISLTGEKSTTDIYVTGTITDDNGCSDIVAGSTYVDAWLTSLTRANCDEAGNASNNNCYYHATCAYDGTVETCSGTDKTGGYKCTVSFQYYANPTDAGTPWAADSWTATLIPGDGQGANAAGEASSAAQEMNSFLALGLATGYATASYGNLNPDVTTDPLLESTRFEATGNCALDLKLSGTDMTGPGTAIPVGNQRYGLGDVAPAWSAGTALSGTATDVALNSCKSGYTAVPEWKRVWWGISVPAGQVNGSYTGTNTALAVERTWLSSGDWCE